MVGPSWVEKLQTQGRGGGSVRRGGGSNIQDYWGGKGNKDVTPTIDEKHQ